LLLHFIGGHLVWAWGPCLQFQSGVRPSEGYDRRYLWCGSAKHAVGGHHSYQWSVPNRWLHDPWNKTILTVLFFLSCNTKVLQTVFAWAQLLLLLKPLFWIKSVQLKIDSNQSAAAWSYTNQKLIFYKVNFPNRSQHILSQWPRPEGRSRSLSQQIHCRL